MKNFTEKVGRFTEIAGTIIFNVLAVYILWQVFCR
jgi:TRAP-type C4-dicarboxylate transport system permease small subunit